MVRKDNNTVIKKNKYSRKLPPTVRVNTKSTNSRSVSARKDPNRRRERAERKKYLSESRTSAPLNYVIAKNLERAFLDSRDYQDEELAPGEGARLRYEDATSWFVEGELKRTKKDVLRPFLTKRGGRHKYRPDYKGAAKKLRNARRLFYRAYGAARAMSSNSVLFWYALSLGGKPSARLFAQKNAAALSCRSLRQVVVNLSARRRFRRFWKKFKVPYLMKAGVKSYLQVGLKPIKYRALRQYIWVAKKRSNLSELVSRPSFDFSAHDAATIRIPAPMITDRLRLAEAAKVAEVEYQRKYGEAEYESRRPRSEMVPAERGQGSDRGQKKQLFKKSRNARYKRLEALLEKKNAKVNFLSKDLGILSSDEESSSESEEPGAELSEAAAPEKEYEPEDLSVTKKGERDFLRSTLIKKKLTVRRSDIKITMLNKKGEINHEKLKSNRYINKYFFENFRGDPVFDIYIFGRVLGMFVKRGKLEKFRNMFVKRATESGLSYFSFVSALRDIIQKLRPALFNRSINTGRRVFYVPRPATAFESHMLALTFFKKAVFDRSERNIVEKIFVEVDKSLNQLGYKNKYYQDYVAISKANFFVREKTSLAEIAAWRKRVAEDNKRRKAAARAQADALAKSKAAAAQGLNSLKLGGKPLTDYQKKVVTIFMNHWATRGIKPSFNDVQVYLTEEEKKLISEEKSALPAAVKDDTFEK